MTATARRGHAARIDGAANASGHADQDVYLKALLATGSVDHIEYGTYVSRVKTAPLAVKDPHGRPQLVGPAWPVMIQDGRGGPVNGAVFMVSYRTAPWTRRPRASRPLRMTPGL